MSVTVEGLTKTYRRGRVRALDGVSLNVKRGEVFGVIGPNGAGKTTLMGCLLGFLRPDSGSVSINGLPPDDLSVLGVSGHVPERLVFDRWMTGREFLAFHHALARLPRGTRERDVDENLERVGLGPEEARRTIRRYSRGMLQRLGVAQAVLARPRYLFLDEPTSGMDPTGAVMVRDLLARLRAEGATVILNSHQLEQVEKMCDRVAFVAGGRVTSEETIAAGAGSARVLQVGITGETDREKLVSVALEAGAELIEFLPGRSRFSACDDETAARLLAALTAAGVRVIHAVPETGSLERLFFDGSKGSSV